MSRGREGGLVQGGGGEGGVKTVVMGSVSILRDGWERVDRYVWVQETMVASRSDLRGPAYWY